MTRHVKKFPKGDIRNLAYEKVRRELATRTFTNFIKYYNRDNKEFVFGKHIAYICEILDKFLRGEIKKLALFLPPQHGKSQTVTETFVAFYIMYHKSKRAMIASYGDKTADKFGKANLEKIIQCGEMFGVALDKRSKSKKVWNLEGERGGFISTTIRGGATSFAADLLVIDDPVKGPSDLTRLKRDEVDDMYRRVFKTRLSGDGQEIMILTRWHTDDLAGRVIDDTWTVIDIPCLATEDDDVLGRKVGEPLFPEIGKDSDWAEATKRDVGEKVWSSMYQQNPRVEDGVMIKRDHIRYFDKSKFDMDRVDEFTMSWDLILKGGEKSDFAVGQLWARVDQDHFLMDMVRGQWTYNETLVMFDKFLDKHSDKRSRILIEDKMNGTNLLNDRKDNRNLVAVGATISKEQRVDNASIEFEAGCVYFPDNEKFTQIVVEEAVGFGSEKYDDAIDACAQYINDYRARRSMRKGYQKGGVAVSAGTGARKDLSVRNSNNALKSVGSKRGVFARR